MYIIFEQESQPVFLVSPKFEPDSSFSHSACQVVLEKEAESLKMKRSHLADTILSLNDKTIKEKNGTNSLFPMEPHRINGGMLSGNNNQEVQLFSLHQQNKDFTNVVTQGISRGKLSSLFQQQSTATTAAKTSSKTMAMKEDVEKMDEEDR